MRQSAPKPLSAWEEAQQQVRAREKALPKFTFEGESTGMPGEYPVGPAAEGFGLGPESTLPPEPPPLDAMAQLLQTPSFKSLKKMKKR